MAVFWIYYVICYFITLFRLRKLGERTRIGPIGTTPALNMLIAFILAPFIPIWYLVRWVTKLNQN